PAQEMFGLLLHGIEEIEVARVTVAPDLDQGNPAVRGARGDLHRVIRKGRLKAAIEAGLLCLVVEDLGTEPSVHEEGAVRLRGPVAVVHGGRIDTVVAQDFALAAGADVIGDYRIRPVG